MPTLKFNLKKILVPTDFSELSMTALHYAAALAKHSDAEILLLHVMQPYEHAAALKNIIDFESVVQKAVEEKMNEISRQKSDLLDVKIHIKVVQGKVFEEAQRFATDESVDLIVMGTHGAGGIGDLERYVLGTNAYRIVHVSQAPVITVRKEQDKVTFKNIVLPLDMTKETKQKVDQAIRIAKVFGSTIHVVSVTSFFDEYRYNLSEIKLQLDEVAEKVKGAGVPVKVARLRHDDVADSVMDYAEEVEADLVIIMTRAESTMNELVLGSSARKVISECKVPVLSLRPQLTVSAV
jgi:nucleotide-binding universal stress UspA family protein